MTFRFRHTISVEEGVRLIKGQRVINLSDLTRAQAWSEHNQEVQSPLTLPTSGLYYLTRFDNTRAHQHRAFQLREQQIWKTKAYDLSVTLAEGRDVAVCSLVPFLDAEGRLQLNSAEGKPLSAEDVQTIWQDLPQLMRCWLDEQAARINGPLADYEALHQEAPSADINIPVYTPAEFSEVQPQRPDPVSLPPEPEYPQPPTVRFWHRLIPKRQQLMARAHQTALHEWQTAKLRWKSETHQAKSASDRARQRYKAYSSVWKARKLAHDTEQQVYAEQFSTLLLNDESVMTEVLIAELSQIDWPRQTTINFEFDLNNQSVWLDYDLPAEELVSDTEAQIVSPPPSLKLRKKSDEQRHNEYARHIYSSTVRLAGVVLGSLPAMEKVIISAYTLRKDQDTGFERDDYLLSVKVSRDAYADLDFSKLESTEPHSILEKFQLKESIQSSRFSTIEPFER